MVELLKAWCLIIVFTLSRIRGHVASRVASISVHVVDYFRVRQYNLHWNAEPVGLQHRPRVIYFVDYFMMVLEPPRKTDNKMTKPAVNKNSVESKRKKVIPSPGIEPGF